MIDNFIYIVDDFLFFCASLLLLYLFILAIASHLKHIEYPIIKKQYSCAILIPEGNTLPSKYKQGTFQFISYSNLAETIQSLDNQGFELVVILSKEACDLSPDFLEKISHVYHTDIQAMQLHTVINDRKGFRKRLQAISAEISNSLFRAGNTQFGLSSNFFGINIVLSVKWIQQNLRTSKTNLERKLLLQNCYIEYLPSVIVYCDSAPTYPYRKRIGKSLSYLLPSLFDGNWSFCNRIFQLLIPTPILIMISLGAWTLFMTSYDWQSSLYWWIILLGFAITYSLAIPDYMVEKKKKLKYPSIWKRH